MAGRRRSEATVEKIVDIGIEDELSLSYGRYAHAIILERALPDVRDGLKPVQRRILYAMAKARNTPDRAYRKCAKTVGNVMGNYHPHGDQSIYAALVRLAQPWKMRLPLVDGHGNFGSVDDDPPAAMRYTEARLDGAAMELLRDIERDTVDFRPNFDESTTEPCVLPAQFPNLLVSGTSGVSTGFATEIPPHNLGEVCEAVCLRVDRPGCSLEEVMEQLPGPDFPTGGILMGRGDLKEAYETGRGRVTLRSLHRIEQGDKRQDLLVVTELPYGVVKADVVRDLEQLHLNRAVQGIRDVRDESDREGMRVVIELQRGADIDGIWNFVLKKTAFQVFYSFNMVAIRDHSPAQMGLLELLDAYIAHRREVIRRRAAYDLARAEARLHVVEGLIRAVDLLDEVIATIRASRDRPDAKTRLMESFSFSEIQADAILDLRLHRLTNLQITALREEETQLAKEIDDLKQLLASERRMGTLLKKELRDVARQLADPRRTEIRAEVEALQVALEVRVKPQDVMVAVTDRGYIKRSSLQSYQGSGGVPENAGCVEGDFPRFTVLSNTTHRVLVFSASGVVYCLPVHTLPETKWAETGAALVNIVPYDMGKDAVVGVFSPPDFAKRRHLLLVTEQGLVKRCSLADFDLRRSGGVVAMKLVGKDRVAAVLDVRADEDVILVTATGQTIRFAVEQVSVQGRAAKGVRGMGVDHGDRVVAAALLPSGAASVAASSAPNAAPPEAEASAELAMFTTASKARRTPLSAFPRQHRGGKGVRGILHRARRPHVILAIAPCFGPDDDFLLFAAGEEPLHVAASALRSTRRDGNAFQLPGLPDSAELRGVIPLGTPGGTEPAGDEEPPEDAGPDEPDEATADVTQMPLLPRP